MPDNAPNQPDYEAMHKQLVLEDEKFKEFVRGHHKFTLERLKEDPRDSLNPELVVMTRDMALKEEVTVLFIGCDFNESKIKQQIMFGAGRMFYEKQQVPVAVILASEVWTSKCKLESDWQECQPRHDPMRTEGVLIAGAGLIQEQRMVIVTPIKRDEANKILIDGDPDEYDKSKFYLIDHFWRGYFSEVIKKEQGKKE